MKKTQEKKLLKKCADGYWTIETDDDDYGSLLELLLDNNISIEHSCGGNASCGTCKLRVDLNSNLPLMDEPEQELVTERAFDNNERLACQMAPRLGLKFKLQYED